MKAHQTEKESAVSACWLNVAPRAGKRAHAAALRCIPEKYTKLARALAGGAARAGARRALRPVGESALLDCELGTRKKR